MEIVITFFRDILSGSLYVVVSIICAILICSCIGYLAEQKELKNKSVKNAQAFNNNIDVRQISGENNNVNTPSNNG